MSYEGPIRVLHVVRPAAGGMRQHVVDLIRHIPSDEVRHAVAAPESFLGQLPPDLNLLSCIPLDISESVHAVRDMKAAMQLAPIARNDFEVVHAHGLRAGWVAAIARKTRRFTLICTSHNIVTTSSASKTGLSLIAGQAAGVIAVSTAVEDSLKACGVPPDMIFVVPNGIDYDYFAGVNEDKVMREAFRNDLMLPPRTFVVGCVARLSREKGIDVLIRAAYDMPDVMFLVAGDGPERGPLQAMAHPNVRFLGRLEDVRPMLAGIDALAAPSREEAQGIAVLEAMAAGVPVVASNIGGLAQMLTNHRNSLLVQVGDARALVVALRRLQSNRDLRTKLASEGRFLAREAYDVRETSGGVLEIYRQLCGLAN